MLKTQLKNAVLAATVFLSAAQVSVQSASAQVTLAFRFHNRTAFDVYSLHVSPSGYTKWGRDILGVNVLPSSSFTNVYVFTQPGICFFDIRAVFRDGSSISRGGFNLCQISDVTLP